MGEDEKGLADKALDGGKDLFGKAKGIAKDQTTDGPTEMLVVSFEDEAKAKEVLETLTELQDRQLVELGNAAVIRRSVEGELDIDETADMDTKEGAVAGAVVGGLLGALTGKGLLGGAILGAGGGALASKGLDLGIDDDFLKKVGEGLQPGSSAIVATVDFTDAGAAMEELDRFAGGTILHTTLQPEIVEQLSAAVED